MLGPVDGLHLRCLLACRREVVQNRRGDVGRRVALLQQPLHERGTACEAPGLEGRRDLVEERVGPAVLDRRHRWHLLTADFRPEKPLDRLQFVDGSPRHERDRLALLAGAARAADAVHVVLGVVGKIVVHHQFEIVDVDAAGGHVGGDQKRKRRPLEVLHHPGPLGLSHAPMDPLGRVAPADEGVGQLIDHPLGVAEDKAALHVVEVDHAHERVELRVMPHLVVDLIHERRSAHRLLRDLDGRGVLRVLADETLDLR